VIVFRRVDTADQAQVLHLLCCFWQQFTDVNSGHGGGDGQERSTGFDTGFRVPAFQLAESAVHVENDDAFLIGFECGSDAGICEGSEATDHGAGTGCHGAEEATASQSVGGGVAGVVE